MAKRKPGKRKRTTVKQVQATEGKPFELPQVSVKPDTDEAEDMGVDGLNMRRRAFVEHITSDCFGNATRAAERAGYASSNRKALEVTGCYLLGIPKVQEAIRLKLADAALTADWTRRAIAAYAMAGMQQFSKVDENGKLSVDWKMAAAVGAIGNVKEIKEDFLPGEDGKPDVVIKRTFKVREPMRALELLAKMHGLIDADAGGAEEPVIRTRPINRHADVDQN